MGGWNLEKSKWANPFSVKEYGLEKCLQMYEQYLRCCSDLLTELPTLRGKRLGCRCVDKPTKLDDNVHIVCHGQILMKVLNELYPE